MPLPYDGDVDPTLRGIQHPNPLFDYLSLFVPRNLKTVFKYCTYLYYNSTQIFAALNKLAIYPITKFIFSDPNRKLVEKYDNLFTKAINLKSISIATGIDKYVYGNSFISIHFPFIRFLKCRHCGHKINIHFADYKFSIRRKKYIFNLNCKECGKTGSAKIVDERLKREKGINVIRWNPQDISIDINPITGEKEFYYTIPGSIKEKVRKGDKHILETIPLSFIETIAVGKQFKFAPGKIYHMHTGVPAGMDICWGLPPILATMKEFFYIAVLKKANEAIALEHIVPFRIMHPAQATASADPTITISLSNWLNEMKMNYKAWRRDPLHLMFAPIPVNVTSVGGQGRALMVTGEIREAESALISSLGIPKEFIYGGLSATGSGVSLRILENQLYNHTVQIIDQAQWIADQCAEFLHWEKCEVDLEPFKLIDDVQQKITLLNANSASGGTLLSNTSLAELFDRDITSERKKRMQEALDEQRFQMELQQKLQEQQENLAEKARASSQMQAPQSYDQQAVIAQADQIVQQLASMDPGTRKSFLHSLQAEDYVMYSVVIQRWEEVRTQNEAIMRQQARQAGAMP